MPKESHELLSMSSSALDRLLKYVENNDLGKIRELIESEGSDILNEEYPYPHNKPILHIACEDFAETIRVSTVETLINLGANVRQCATISKKEVIHAAVAGKNPHILSLIVKDDHVNLNATANENTALNLLVRGGAVDTENFNKCLDILLKSNVDVNKADGKGYTPILWAAHKGYKNVVSAIMECGKDVDIETHKIRGKNARELIEEKHLYQLPAGGRDNNSNRIKSPIMLINERREREFLDLTEVDPNETIEEGTILQLACKNNMYQAVKRLLERSADETKTALKYKATPLEIAAKEGNPEIFELLLKKYEKKDYPKGLLTTLLKNINLFQHNKAGYKKCLNILLDQKHELPLNEYSDTNNTPLHYSSGSADPGITLKLLDKGASLANENYYNTLPVEDIDTDTLKVHFDRCISVDRQDGNDKQNIVVKFDYKSLIPTVPVKIDKGEKDKYTLISVENDELLCETGVIQEMSRIPEMHQLLIHPLIASFVDIKWHRMRWFFRTNLLLFLVFCLTFVGYVFVPDDEDEQANYSPLITCVWIILMVSYVMIVLRELFQLVLSFRTYCCSLPNILEVTMLLVCFYPIFYKSPSMLYKQLSSIAMVLIALEVMVLLGQHPTWSTNIVMLRTVAKNFFTFLLWYAVLLIAFVMCFYKLFNNNNNIDNTKSNSTEDTEPDFFGEPGLTFIKTIVMLTGEFDAASINFDTVWNRLIFLLFIFMIPIILFNLLNGLAVSDTQQIKSEAEIVGYRERINYIVYLENIILGKKSLRPGNDCLLRGYSGTGLRRWIPQSTIRKVFLIPDYLPNKSMRVKLYHDGIILEGDEATDRGCFNFCSRVKIDKKILKRVKNLLHKKHCENEQANQLVKELQDVIRCQKEIIQQLTSQRNISNE